MKKNVYLAGLALLALVACNKTPKTEPQPVDFSQYAVRLEPVITRATETNFDPCYGRVRHQRPADLRRDRLLRRPHVV